MATSLVAELAEKLSSATNNFDIDESTIFVNTSADTVGIGTTSPSAKLDVRGSAIFNEGGLDADFRIEGDTETHLFFLDASTGRIGINSATPGVRFDVVGATKITGGLTVGVDDTGHDVKFFGATSGAYLEWDESADELEIRGGAATPGKLLLSTAETTVVDGNKLGQIDFQAPVDSAGTDAILVGASIYAEADNTFSSSVNATELVFATGASEAAAEKMRIDSAGKVGIGTSAPAEMLEIYNAANPSIQLNDGGDYQAIMRLGGNDLEIRGSSGKMEFYTGNADGDSSSMRMAINATGHTSVAGNLRQLKLGRDPGGTANASVVQKWITTDGTDGTDGTYSYADTYSYGSSASNMGAFRWYSTSGTGQGDAVRLEIALNGEVAGNLTDTSDGRLKENIEKIADGALSTIKELNPVKFAWKDTKVVNSGFVAQDVEKIIPEVMGGSEERKTIHTSGILAYAVKAIQELTEKVETQEKELAHLKG